LGAKGTKQKRRQTGGAWGVTSRLQIGKALTKERKKRSNPREEWAECCIGRVQPREDDPGRGAAPKMWAERLRSCNPLKGRGKAQNHGWMKVEEVT